MKRAFIFSFLLLACLCVLLLPQPALASQLIVNCDNPKAKYHSINAALSQLDPHTTNTLLISGTCNELVTVDGFTRLTLAGNPTATVIGSKTGGGDITLFITNSPNVTVQDMNLQGGWYTLWCNESLCYFTNLVVQGAAQAGVHVLRASARFDNCTVQGSAGWGLSVSVGDAYLIGGTLDNNAFYGAWLQKNAMLVVTGNLSVRNNGSDSPSPGIFVQNNSTLQINAGEANVTRTISGNSAHGISVQTGSVAFMGGASITGNGYSGIDIQLSSVADLQGGVSISGNTGGPQVRVGDLSIVRFHGDPANSVFGLVDCWGQSSYARGYPSLVGTPSTTCDQTK